MRIGPVRAVGLVVGGVDVMFYLRQNATDKEGIELVTDLEPSGLAVWAVVHVDFLSDAKAEGVQIGDKCIIVTEDQWLEYQKLHEHSIESHYRAGVV